MKFLGYTNVLCLSPHPDDIEYSIMGTVMKYNETQFHVFCFSEGGDFDETTTIHRVQESINCWNVSKCKNYTFTKSDRKFIKDKTSDEWISFLESKFDLKIFDCILIPTCEDSHFEHVIVHNIGIPLGRIIKIDIIEYRTPSTLTTWAPTAFVDISNFLELKLKCLLEFKSQQHRVYFKDDVLHVFHANFQCAKRGLINTEQYNVMCLYV